MTYLNLVVLVCAYLVTSSQLALGIPAYADEDGASISLSIENNGDMEGVDIDISVNGNENDCGCEECDCQDEETFAEASTTSTTSTAIRNCDDVYYNNNNPSDGVYTIFTGFIFVEVYCEFPIGGPNWMVFQRRINGEVDFFLNWTDYVSGFGNANGEFWLGLQPLFEITSSQSYRLQVEVQDWEDEIRFAEYGNFAITGGDNLNYPLHVSGYSGSAGDSLIVAHNGQPFSTFDRDNDAWPNNCAERYKGAWWYNACFHSNLNGKYRTVGPGDADGLSWRTFNNDVYYSMKQASMKIRPN